MKKGNEKKRDNKIIEKNEKGAGYAKKVMKTVSNYRGENHYHRILLFKLVKFGILK